MHDPSLSQFLYAFPSHFCFWSSKSKQMTINPFVPGPLVTALANPRPFYRYLVQGEEIFQTVPKWARIGPMVHEFSPPLSISVPFHMYFKLHWCTVYYSVLQVQGRERGQSKYLRSQRGIELKASSTEVLILIDYKGTNPCSLNRGSAGKYRVIQVTGKLQFVTLRDVS